MRIGASIRSFYPPGDARAGARSMLERAAAARTAGLDSLFVGDHHATSAPYYQNVPMLARMLAEWGDAPVGALFLIPLWDPVLLAEQIGTLAALSPGRFIAQCCVGADPAQFHAMGADPRRRGREFEERFQILQRLLTGKPISRSAEARAVGIDPIPTEPVEYWSGAEAPIAIDRAARMADAWMPGPNVPLPEARKQLHHYRERCEVHGRPPRATPIRRNIHVAENAADLERRVRPALAAANVRTGVDPDCAIAGTVEQVAERFAELEAAGFSEVIVRHFLDEPAAVLDSYGRLAEVRKQILETGRIPRGE